MRSALDQAGIAYEYINIRQDEAGRARVREINAGCESVPTLVFPDGSTLTEPSPHALQQKLDRLDLQPGAALDPEGALPRYTALALAGAGGAVLLGGLVLDIPAAQVGGVLLLLVWMGRWFFRGRA